MSEAEPNSITHTAAENNRSQLQIEQRFSTAEELSRRLLHFLPPSNPQTSYLQQERWGR